jgi:hypothetical protein
MTGNSNAGVSAGGQRPTKNRVKEQGSHAKGPAERVLPMGTEPEPAPFGADSRSKTATASSH